MHTHIHSYKEWLWSHQSKVIHIHSYIHTYIHTYKEWLWSHQSKVIHIHAFIHTYIHTYIHIKSGCGYTRAR